MGVNSVDSSFAGWAEGALGAAESYAEAQAQAAVDAEAKARDESAKGIYVPPNDGLDPTPSQRAEDSFWGHDPNRPGLGANGAPPPEPTYVTDEQAELLQKHGIQVATDDHGRQYVDDGNTEKNIEVSQKVPPSSWALLPGGSPPPEATSPGSTNGAGEGGAADPTSPEPTNVATEPVAPTPTAKPAPPIVSGLGEKVDALLNMTPTIRALWDECQKRGIKVVIFHGKREDASNWNADDNKIYINMNGKGPDGDPNLKLASILAHEIGHATGKITAEPTGNTKEEYIRSAVGLFCDGEGEAAFANAAAQAEILGNGGPDIGIRGGKDEDYLSIYRSYEAGHISADEAKFRMGVMQGQETTALTGPSPTRAEVAARDAADAWEEKHAEKQR